MVKNPAIHRAFGFTTQIHRQILFNSAKLLSAVYNELTLSYLINLMLIINLVMRSRFSIA